MIYNSRLLRLVGPCEIVLAHAHRSNAYLLGLIAMLLIAAWGIARGPRSTHKRIASEGEPEYEEVKYDSQDADDSGEDKEIENE